MAGRATKGSHCIRRKRTKHGMRCAVFSSGKKGSKKRKSKRGRRGLSGLAGSVSQCIKWRKGKKGVKRCARFYRGPGYPSVALRKAAGIKNPAGVERLRKIEAAARLARAKKTWRSWKPPVRAGERKAA